MRRVLFYITILVYLLHFPVSAQKAPNFSLYDINGKRHYFSQIVKTAPLIISFWATYCLPCREEIDEIKKAGFSIPIYYINVDSGNNLEFVKQTIDSWQIPETVLLDSYQVVMSKFSGEIVLPAFYFIDKKSNIILSGNKFNEETGKKIKNILAQQKKSGGK